MKATNFSEEYTIFEGSGMWAKKIIVALCHKGRYLEGGIMKDEEQKQWDLTEKENKKLKVFQAHRIAVEQLMETLLGQIASNHEQEYAWWKAIRLNHKIPDAFMYKLAANPSFGTHGKVWVKGEVPELDSKDC